MDRREQRRQHKEKEREQKNKHDQAYENEAQKATTAGSSVVDGCGSRLTLIAVYVWMAWLW